MVKSFTFTSNLSSEGLKWCCLGTGGCWALQLRVGVGRNLYIPSGNLIFNIWKFCVMIGRIDIDYKEELDYWGSNILRVLFLFSLGFVIEYLSHPILLWKTFSIHFLPKQGVLWYSKIARFPSKKRSLTFKVTRTQWPHSWS